MYTIDFAMTLFVNGVITGSVYVLVAMGLTLIFGILHVVNFAHGEFYMLGGYFGIVAVMYSGMPLLAALLVCMVLIALIGMLAERLVFRPIRGRDPTDSIISSFGLAVAMQNAALLVFGPQPQIIRTEMARVTFSIFGVFMTLQRAIIPIIAAVLVIVFHLVLRYTWTGRALRAVAQHPTVATLSGVDVNRVALATFAIGAALAAGAGVMMSSVFMVQPAVGNTIALKAFTVVILGGMGNIYGAVAAGLLLGIVESFVSGYISNEAREIVGFALVILVLMVQPSGLFSFGKAVDRA
ncbi:MAG: branched-chain amino acid ABC transporter permease [Alphaproteobacteria bacterium]|uniref:Branched-chain amino acid ABC transporter permease n=1 Tax=Futiania mangrovi TaxID=2959716 RepID=A0A9J6P9W1_9PROT|nr:branched-chain amino acid ABC transporter permease [Futiania mangrovii]MCP1335129.1 branched-chain amino acid ABC transporter permease [Futiania mangrovii]MDX5360837.1 branched-chain amino acid ABC transporter permease [Alphaproteobacteria bacterium]MDX5368992.1 branched-chain amino acid ABC transporter permease [Alphaproteobacteria bacterium]MDX5463692.1 branched-chain amino acid ABC transporter permease [Alphaproteobacteria bacterium]